MHRKVVVAGVAAMCLAGLAGCSSKTDTEKKSDEIVQEASKGSGELPRAGQWENAVEIVDFQVPGAPPQLAEMMKSAMGKVNSSKGCMTDEQAQSGLENNIKKSMNTKDCTSDEFSAKNGVISGKMACSTASGGTMDVAMSGNYSQEAMNIDINALIKDASMPTGEATMKMRMTGKRLGDCPG